MVRNILIAAAAFALLAGGASAQNEPKGDAKAGATHFQKLGCYSCHGIWGQGTLRDGPRLNPPMPYPALLAQVRTPRYEMPPYTESQISDQAVADIYAYLASIPKAPDPKSIKLLQ